MKDIFFIEKKGKKGKKLMNKLILLKNRHSLKEMAEQKEQRHLELEVWTAAIARQAAARKFHFECAYICKKKKMKNNKQLREQHLFNTKYEHT